jgi:hypothetical protein
VDNRGKKRWIRDGRAAVREIHRVKCKFLESFPRFFDGKRYKLINFAPKIEIVDKLRIARRLNKLALTMGVKTTHPRVDNLSSK